ncbi:N-acetylmuramoyl-L-alanine amidase [Streptomyces pluripotens]|uniref:N-acetylmuramoyl-L-alanine amidase n=1 Tax=Streptomyces pluripotens TaxID=1355015 RepID=A0A221NTT7_9ACTN|nr:peptidoglycan recognition family protein [Streptomyces pluripotens]ASN23371.1 N-acetylmuramoyl-L-alanine amidase [Streptomyces pluripotens]
MRRTAASCVPDVLRGHRRKACLLASAALMAPVLFVPASGRHEAPDQLQDVFADAAHAYHVPQSVLMGVSYMQSRWDAHPGDPSVAGGYGPMHLLDVGTGRGRFPAPAAGPPARHGAHTGPAHAPAAHASGAPRSHAGQSATLERAARLIRLPAGRLRTDPAANVRGGAALLAATQRQLGKPLSDDPADWWEAVKRFAGTQDTTSATTYAHDVFALIRKGAHRTTAEGEDVTLNPRPGVRHHITRPQPTRRQQEVECPPELSCDWLSAPHEEIDDGEYGNYDLADRPRDQKIEYIVIHDTEARLPIMFQTVQDPTEASWHYSIRSRDGHITQHVRTKDEAWHSGSQFVNARSIGIEHEGFLSRPGTWYSEPMYRASARLVRYLAKKYGIPLDRQHIFGHYDVPSPTAATIPDMHDDPGPFWDWRHYFDLLGAPLRSTAGPGSGMVMILPDYAAHKPVFTGCDDSGGPCPPHGSSAVRLHTEPDEDAPLVQDPGRRPDGDDSTEDVNDLGSRVSAGQIFAVAGRSGAWTAIWYQGRKAWFKNPGGHPTAVGASGRMVRPKKGLDEIPVFGRALPEEDAYPESIPEKPESPLPYRLLAGQRYVTQASLDGSYVVRSSFSDTADPVVKGQERYYEIQFGHRLAYVRASDVDVVSAPVAAGPPAASGSRP